MLTVKTTKKKLVLKKKTIAQLTEFTIDNKRGHQLQGGKTQTCQTHQRMVCFIATKNYFDCGLTGFNTK